MILIGILLVLTIGMGCGKDSFSPYTYTLKIRFVDLFGNDKVHGIDYVQNNNKIYEIKPDVYKVEVAETGKAKEDLFLRPLSLEKAEPYDRLVLTTTTLALPDYHPSQLTHTLVCSSIFGDNSKHTIISNWESKATLWDVCTGMSVDGNTFMPTETDEQGNSVFTITVDE